MMRTHAAGTFSLNCAYLGIPCIGYKGLDTQEICFPELSVKLGDLYKAKQFINQLHNDKDFYNECSIVAKMAFEHEFKEDIYKTKIENIFNEILKGE